MDGGSTWGVSKMFRKILSYGVIAGLIVGIPLSAIVVSAGGHEMHYGMLIGYATMLVGLSTVFVAVKRHRDPRSRRGSSGFWPALGLGLGISVVASVVYVVAWESTVALTHLDFANGYAKMLIEQKKAAGVTGAALAKFTAEMEQFKVQYANPF